MSHTNAQPDWNLVRREMERLLDLPPEARPQALAAVRAEHPRLAGRVEELLASAAGPGLDADGAWAALAGEIAPSAPAPGQAIGRYRLERMLGSGGMGAVFEAADAELGRSVALKFVWTGPLTGESIRRFKAEARSLARLSHPAIARLFDVGSWEQPCKGLPGGVERVPFIAMEFVRGAAWITEFAQRRALDLDARLALFVGVLEAVHEAHQRGVIHRDLKPANILVDDEGNPKVIDFGIARVLDAASPGAGTQTTSGSGTLQYMSPESLSAGEGAEPDARSDLYSLGVVLYELLEDRSPFRYAQPQPGGLGRAPGRGPAGMGPLIDEIREGAWRRPELRLASGRSARADLSAVIAKAMARAAADRYESVAAFAADLRRIRAGEPVQARPASAWRDVGLLARRNRALAVAILVGVAALTLGAAGGWAGMVRARHALAEKELESRRLARMVEFFRGTMQSANPNARLDGSAAPIDGWLHGSQLGPPIRRVGGGVQVVDVLRWAAERVAGQFADDPVLRARVQLRLAASLGAAYDFATGYRLLCEAFPTLRSKLGPDHEDTLRTHVLLAAQGPLVSMPLAESAALLTDAAERLERLHGGADFRVEFVQRNLGHTLALLDRQEEALKVLDRLIDALSAALGPESERVWVARAVRAHVLATSNRRAKGAACAQFEEAYHNLLRIAGEHTPSTLDAASLGMLMGCGAGAEITYARVVIEGTTRLYGPAAAHEARTVLARALMRTRDLPGAEVVLREQLVYARENFGESSYVVCKVKGFLARVLTWAGKDLEEAERLAAEAARDAQLIHDYHKGHDWEAWFNAIWARAIRLRGDPDRAEIMLRELLELRRGKNWAAWCDAYVHTELAETMLDLGWHAECREFLAQAASFVLATNDPGSPMALSLQECRERAERASPPALSGPREGGE